MVSSVSSNQVNNLTPVSQTNSVNTTSNVDNSNSSFSNLLVKQDSELLKKPNIKELMDISGINFDDASSILYGVVGSNEDTRDWNKILTSSDVLKTAKEETNLMYNKAVDETNPYQSTLEMETGENPVKKHQDIQEGNFRYLQTSRAKEDVKLEAVSDKIYLAASNGTLLRYAGDTPEEVYDNIDAFGFSYEPLKALAAKETIPNSVKQLLNETIEYANKKNKTTNTSIEKQTLQTNTTVAASSHDLLSSLPNVVNNNLTNALELVSSNDKKDDKKEDEEQ